MGEIYAAAKQVIVWLGRDTKDLDAILWALKVFVPFINSYESET